MAEYESFHYLMHKIEDGPAAFMLGAAKPLTFEELYTPREQGLRKIGEDEKHYWRTRDRLKYTFYELRKEKLLIITAVNVEVKPNETLRTILVHLPAIYHEVEAKAAGKPPVELVISKKSERKLADDAALDAAVIKYLSARLSIKKEPIPWPMPLKSEQNSATTETAKSVETSSSTTAAAPGSVVAAAAAAAAAAASTTNTADDNTADDGGANAADGTTATADGTASSVDAAAPAPTEPTERMATLEKLTGDEYESIEILGGLPPRNPKIDLEALGIPVADIKLAPTTSATTDAAVSTGANAISESAEGSTGSTTVDGEASEAPPVIAPATIGDETSVVKKNVATGAGIEAGVTTAKANGAKGAKKNAAAPASTTTVAAAAVAVAEVDGPKKQTPARGGKQKGGAGTAQAKKTAKVAPSG